MMNPVKTLALTAIAGGALFFGGLAQAQTAGSQGNQQIPGYSWVKSGLDKSVTNEAGDEVGTAIDIIMERGLKVTHVVVKSGTVLGMGGNIIAIPVERLGYAGGGFVLRGVTVDDMKKMPTFKYLAE